jgi:hypothetical protein
MLLSKSINMRELLKRYLLGQYITPMTWNNCLQSRKDLVLLLSGWLQLTSSETIGDPNIGVGVLSLIRLQIGHTRYRLNADTNRKGVEVFLKNARNGNPWTISDKNRVSNAQNGEHIMGLHMYRLIN